MGPCLGLLPALRQCEDFVVPNNNPLADFFCTICNEEFELKSQKGKFGAKVLDGEFKTKCARLAASNNPSLLLMNYDLKSLAVVNLFIVPKHFFVRDIIEEREPVAATARRAGWIGLKNTARPRSGIGQDSYCSEWRHPTEGHGSCGLAEDAVPAGPVTGGAWLAARRLEMCGVARTTRVHTRRGLRLRAAPWRRVSRKPERQTEDKATATILTRSWLDRIRIAWTSSLAILARLRGFALENADFEIFSTVKSLICNERRLRFRPKTVVVKTYPIPKRGMVRIDSLHHVCATHRATKERQDTPLLERGGEQAP
ncbi:MAG TPA: DpnI domain-containing protein [Terriglobales bacterium]